MDYIILKALHVIGIVCWFAGLFYMVRLYIYHAEADAKPEPARGILIAQFQLMQRRLWYGITWPAMLLTAVTGGWLLKFHPIAQSPWLHLKFALLAVLIAYHFHCGWVRKKFAAGLLPLSSHQLRIYNEVPTFLLVGIVFTAVSKTVSTGLWSLAGCAVFFVIVVAFFLKKLQGKP
ncbi:MAG: CopD family protein [Opitutales bacterium]